MLVTQPCPTLCNPIDCSPPVCSILGILQARMLKWVAISFSRWSYWPRDQIQVSHIAGRFFTIWGTRSLNTLNTLLSYGPAVTLLFIHSKELSMYVHTKSCMWMFTAALFIIANTWKQPRCSSLGECVNKLWYQNGILFSSKKKWVCLQLSGLCSEDHPLLECIAIMRLIKCLFA